MLSLKKIKKLFLLLKAKYIFKNPKNYDVIIFDKKSSINLGVVFSKIKYTFLSNRVEEIEEIFISHKILTFIFKNFFKRSLKINYLLAVIKIINPKILITRIDTSKDFHALSRLIYKQIRCISLQQGDRTLILPGGKIETLDVKKKDLDKYFIPYFFIFSKYDKKVIQPTKAKIYRFEEVGSIKSSLALNYFKKKKLNYKKKIYNFCLISDPDFNSPTGIIASYLDKFCRENNFNYIIAGDSDLSDGSELSFYRNYIKYDKINISKNNYKFYSSYYYALKSNLVIGHNSTLLRECLGLKKKVLSINGSLNNIGSLNIFYYRKIDNKIIWTPKKNAYDLFVNRVSKLNKMTDNEYFSLFKNSSYFMPKKIDTIKIIKKKILKYL